MKRTLRLVGILALVQLGFFGVYLALRDEAQPSGLRRVHRRSPELVYESHDGQRHELSATSGPVLLHFWATWCPPCREELPALLEYARSSNMQVLAVALDSEWPPVTAFLGGAPPAEVVRARSEAAKDFEVETLPVTFVVTADGWISARLDGPQDWSSTSVRRAVEKLSRAHTPPPPRPPSPRE